MNNAHMHIYRNIIYIINFILPTILSNWIESRTHPYNATCNFSLLLLDYYCLFDCLVQFY
jgi:hypothetical protein